MGINVIKMTDEDIIYHVEVFLLFYLGKVDIVKNGKSDKLANGIFNANYKDILEKSLKVFLKEPLKDPRFRKKFNEYFENHELEVVRIHGSLWLSEILVWED
jgi:hypothetical protein